ncbi:unknown protein [Seminavis robusta]|uniref:Uncharacterized protein n=1 Tax=Seminavis robusta TaxID=568900 RepID=A0A9N8HRU0_9STRA|nr:unknown protein [Seminavis robusta]|eukprot:Sro1621_g286560.1 n/a (405) ;mRNA; r:3569-5130
MPITQFTKFKEAMDRKVEKGLQEKMAPTGRRDSKTTSSPPKEVARQEQEVARQDQEVEEEVSSSHAEEATAREEEVKHSLPSLSLSCLRKKQKRGGNKMRQTKLHETLPFHGRPDSDLQTAKQLRTAKQLQMQLQMNTKAAADNPSADNPSADTADKDTADKDTANKDTADNKAAYPSCNPTLVPTFVPRLNQEESEAASDLLSLAQVETAKSDKKTPALQSTPQSTPVDNATPDKKAQAAPYKRAARKEETAAKGNQEETAVQEAATTLTSYPKPSKVDNLLLPRILQEHLDGTEVEIKKEFCEQSPEHFEALIDNADPGLSPILLEAFKRACLQAGNNNQILYLSALRGATRDSAAEIWEHHTGKAELISILPRGRTKIVLGHTHTCSPAFTSCPWLGTSST